MTSTPLKTPPQNITPPKNKEVELNVQRARNTSWADPKFIKKQCELRIEEIYQGIAMFNRVSEAKPK